MPATELGAHAVRAALERAGISSEAQETSPSNRTAAQAAIESGKFEQEVVSVPVNAKPETVEFTVGEHVRHGVARDVSRT